MTQLEQWSVPDVVEDRHIFRHLFIHPSGQIDGGRPLSALVRARTQPWPPSPLAGLHPVIALDDQDIGLTGVEAQRHRVGVLRRAVALRRRLVAGELEHHIARPGRALDRLEPAAPDHEPGAVLGERCSIRRDVLLVTLRVGDIDPADPVSLLFDILSTC